MKELADKTLNAMFAIRKKVNFHNLPAKLAVKIFDSVLSPILLYNSEVWGASTDGDLNKWDKTPTEKAHVRFCKIYLGVNKKATNIACRGELGKFPLIFNIYKRMFKYISEIYTIPNSTVVKQAVIMSKKEFLNKKPSLNTNLWKILKTCDPSIEINQLENLSTSQITKFINNSKEKYTNFWRHKLKNSSKMSFLTDIKTNYELEVYLISIKNPTQRRTLTQFRTSSHTLKIERGRYNNVPREERLCEYCDSQEIEDEYHFALSCNYYEKYRNDLVCKLQSHIPTITKFETNEDLIQIVSSKDPILTIIFSKYITLCFSKRNNCLESR